MIAYRPTPASPPAATQVDWRRVGLFLLIAVGGTWVVGLALAALLPVVGVTVVRVLMAVLYMPMPLVAGLVVELTAGRRPLLVVRTLRHLKADARRLGGIVARGVLPALTITLVAVLLTVVAAAAGLPGAGRVMTTSQELAAALSEVVGVPIPDDVTLPPPWVLAAISVVQGVVAGATLNALLAFGEEYGWRGVLAEELAPLGRWRAHTLIGSVWGLWHAPAIIWLGLNYRGDWALGIPAMVAMCIPLGFVLAWAAERSGVFAAAIGHGVVNGTVGIVYYLVADGNPFVVPPGMIFVVVAALVAFGLWTTRSRTAAASAAQSAKP